MSDATGAPAGAPDPNAGIAPVETPPADAPLHPVWDRAMGAIPEMLRGPLVDQIRTTEREHQSALEQARAGAAPTEWQGLIAEAAQLGVTPGDLAQSYASAQAIRENPVKFVNEMTELIEQRAALPATDPNHLDAATVRWMKREAAAGAQALADGTVSPLGVPDPDDPAVKALAAVEQLRAEQKADRDQQQQQQAEQVAAQTAREYASNFIATVDTATAGASDPQKNMIASWANALIQGDTTGRLTPQQAIDAAVKAAKDSGMVWQPLAPGAAAPAPAAAPVGGGSAAVPGAAAPAKVANIDTPAGKNQQRENMLAAAASLGPIDDSMDFGVS